jgi:hypothetical protein
MGFVVDKVTMEHVFVRVLLFSPVNIVPPWLSMLIYHLGMNNRPAGGRSSETSSHPIDMMIINNTLLTVILNCD